MSKLIVMCMLLLMLVQCKVESGNNWGRGEEVPKKDRTWIIKCYSGGIGLYEDVASFYSISAGEVWAALKELPGLELMVGTLDPEQYYDFVSGIDVMLLPFRPGIRTQLHGSGVFFECLALGQVMVLPQGSHFEAEARRLGAGYTAFVSNEPADIAKATLRAVEGLGDLSSRARRASKRFRKERDLAHFFDRALALPRPVES